jgi:hypothetical protein
MPTISMPTTARPHRHPLSARLRARLLPGALDTALAAGADPRRTDALQARAERLISPGFRQAVATGLERTIEAAAKPPSALTPAAPLRRAAVTDAASELEMLATLLRDVEAPAPCGVARAWLLLVDGNGPLFCDLGQDCSVAPPAPRHKRSNEPSGSATELPTGRDAGSRRSALAQTRGPSGSGDRSVPSRYRGGKAYAQQSSLHAAVCVVRACVACRVERRRRSRRPLRVTRSDMPMSAATASTSVTSPSGASTTKTALTASEATTF